MSPSKVRFEDGDVETAEDSSEAKGAVVASLADVVEPPAVAELLPLLWLPWLLEGLPLPSFSLSGLGFGDELAPLTGVGSFELLNSYISPLSVDEDALPDVPEPEVAFTLVDDALAGAFDEVSIEPWPCDLFIGTFIDNRTLTASFRIASNAKMIDKYLKKNLILNNFLYK